jgi:imidazolonepropionase-like amidohydrolase
MQIIHALARDRSESLGIEKDFGAPAKGKAADPLVLAKNPRKNTAGMRTIQAVYLGGK